MRVLIVSQYFVPEITAASLRLGPIAAGLAARGHTVEVVCEAPSHPRGVIDADFRRRLLTRRRAEGYTVSHVWVRSSESKRARARLAWYASFAATGVLVGALKRRPDVILASSPPLSVGVVGALLAVRYRAPLVFDVRDLWPEVAVALGELEPGRVLNAAERIERSLYERAAAVTTPTEEFRERIAEIAGSPEGVHVLPNGVARARLEAGGHAPDRAAAGLPEDRFVWTYAGNLGLSQNLEVAIEAARLLGNDFQLLLLGDGTARAGLEALAAELPKDQVAFRDSVPPEQAQVIMRASDALAVILADVPALSRTVPVKLYDSCAAGRPVILAARGASRRVAERDGAALALDPGDPASLADGVRSIRDDEELRSRLIEGGRRFAADSVRENGVLTLESVLEEAIARHRRGE